MAIERHELVLLPGLDGTGDLFDRLQRLLSKDHDVTIVRYPSDPSMGYDDYLAFAKEAIGARRVIVLGESFSGPIAVKLAVALPAQVYGIVLAATFLRSPWPPFAVRAAAGVNPLGVFRIARDAFLMGRYRDAEMSAKVDHIVANFLPELRAARILAVAGVDVRAEFASLSRPILALHGSEDWVVPPHAMRADTKSKFNAEFVVFEAAHMLLQTRPTATAEAIFNFIKRIPDTA